MRHVSYVLVPRLLLLLVALIFSGLCPDDRGSFYLCLWGGAKEMKGWLDLCLPLPSLELRLWP